jgi:hypothetical protein
MRIYRSLAIGFLTHKARWDPERSEKHQLDCDQHAVRILPVWKTRVGLWSARSSYSSYRQLGLISGTKVYIIHWISRHLRKLPGQHTFFSVQIRLSFQYFPNLQSLQYEGNEQSDLVIRYWLLTSIHQYTALFALLAFAPATFAGPAPAAEPLEARAVAVAPVKKALESIVCQSPW